MKIAIVIGRALRNAAMFAIAGLMYIFFWPTLIGDWFAHQPRPFRWLMWPFILPFWALSSLLYRLENPTREREM